MPVHFHRRPKTEHAKNQNKKNIRTSGPKKTNVVPSTELLNAMLEEAGVPNIHQYVDQDHHTLLVNNETIVYRRRQVMRLVLRGVHPSQVADHLGLPLRIIKEDLHAINTDMRKELQELDYVTYVGMAVQFYDEVRSMGMNLASSPRATNRERAQGMRAALDAESRKHEFMARVGLFKLVKPTDPFSHINTGRTGSFSDENDLNLFVNLASKALSDLRRTVEPDQPEVTDVQPRAIQ